MTTRYITQLQRDFPSISFVPGNDFYWNHETSTIFFDQKVKTWEALLLHEIGHASLAHSFYTHDIELLQMEVTAWQKANELSAAYGVSIDEELVESSLETYRDWLHRRSMCPNCDSSGLQNNSEYICVLCHHRWKVNEAKTCRLRRVSKKTIK